MPYKTLRYDPNRAQTNLYKTLTHANTKFKFANDRPRELVKFKPKAEYVIFKH